jgi:class 3 adenylate cyclase
MQEQVAGWCAAQGIDPRLVLKLGVHVGPAIAMTANQRLDYFGRTVNLAARLGDRSEGDDVVLLAEVFEQAAARIASGRPHLSVEGFQTRLRGLAGEQQLVRLTFAAPAEPPSREAEEPSAYAAGTAGNRGP